MARALKQYTVRKLRQQAEGKVKKDIEWICNSLGFISSRDQDKTAFKIMEILIKAAKEKKGKTSEELTKEVNPTIGAVIYHLNKLTKAGLVTKIDSEYMLKLDSLSATINDLQREINASLEDIKEVAEAIDKEL